MTPMRRLRLIRGSAPSPGSTACERSPSFDRLCTSPSEVVEESSNEADRDAFFSGPFSVTT
jgi:hypothetical protein